MPLKFFKKPARFVDGSPLPAFNLAVVYNKKDEPEEALRLIEDCAAKFPEFAPAILEKARTLNKLEKFSDAADAFRAYVKARRDDDHSWVSLAIADSDAAIMRPPQRRTSRRNN